MATLLEQHIRRQRSGKAERLAAHLWDAWDALQRRGPGLLLVSQASPRWWRQLAEAAGENAPSADTRELVLQKLREREQHHLSLPICGAVKETPPPELARFVCVRAPGHEESDEPRARRHQGYVDGEYAPGRGGLEWNAAQPAAAR